MAFTMKISTTCQRSLVVLIALAIGACAGTRESGVPPIRMVEVLLTSESGHKLASMEVKPFHAGIADGTVISVFPRSTKQTIDGIGSSFTESSAFVLAHLEPGLRREVMQRIYGESGADFTLTRTHIGSCDFTVEGKYSYAEIPDDETLTAFSIAPDLAGFDPADYPGIKDASYDLLPMIQEAIEVKRGQLDRELRIIASAWTAPPWMKNIETWYISASPWRLVEAGIRFNVCRLSPRIP
jgi:glucosylceramidase